MNDSSKEPKSLKGTWPQALASFLLPLGLFFTIRFFVFEPFVIPSSSMVPNLLIHDHILVNKLQLGLRNPLDLGFLWKWSKPERGDIIVFRYPKNPQVFFVKRLMGLPGDKIQVQQGAVYVNGTALTYEAAPTPPTADDSSFEYFYETTTNGRKYLIRYLDRDSSQYSETEVPQGTYFVMGDNRDQSSDSRVWGFVDAEQVIGRPLFIWLSCAETLPSNPMLCDPGGITWSRIFKSP